MSEPQEENAHDEVASRTDEELDALAAEVEDWDSGNISLDDWLDAPEAVPLAGESVQVSIRLPRGMRDVLKAFAEREGTGYQTLLKRWVDDRIREEAALHRSTRLRAAERVVHAAQEWLVHLEKKGAAYHDGVPGELMDAVDDYEKVVLAKG